MRPSPLLALVVVLLLAFLSTGCVHSRNRAEGNRVAVALTVNGTEQPNAQQWASIIKALKPHLDSLGLVLVQKLADADRILRVDFTPDPAAPNTEGNATFLGWRINPLAPLAYVFSPATNVSQVNYSSGLSAYHNSPYGWDRYSDYSYSYAYGGGVPNPTPAVTPPEKTGHRGNRPEDCPPGTPPHERGGPGRFVGTNPDHRSRPGHGHPGEHPPRPSPRYPASPGESSGTSSGGGSSYASSSSSGSSYSSSSGSSSSSNSFSSSSGSSSASGSSGSIGGSSSGGSSGTHDSPTQKQN